MKTIDIQAKEYFDKKNANSYFSSLITVDFGMETEKTFSIPFTYGYETQYIHSSLSLLQKNGLIDTISRYELRVQGIEVRSSIQLNCSQKEVKNYV